MAAFTSSIIRLLVEGLLPLAIDWQQMLALLAIASLLVGNLAAIAQTNLKRMLAYSTIAQMGFMLLGLVAGVVNGNTYNAQYAYSASMFYVISYVLTTLASFGIILLLAREGFESEEIVDLAGLNQRSPLYAGVMAIAMFSLAGLPPLVGFDAKFAVLQALIASGQAIYIGIAVFAVMMSLVGSFYYLRVVKVMYFDEPVTATTVSAPRDVRTVLSINGALILILGIVPGGLMTLCADNAIVRHAGDLILLAMSQDASVWVVLLLLALARRRPCHSSANRLFGLLPLRSPRKSLAIRFGELVVLLYGVVGAVGLLFEEPRRTGARRRAPGVLCGDGRALRWCWPSRRFTYALPGETPMSRHVPSHD